MNCPYSLAGSPKDFTLSPTLLPQRLRRNEGKPCHSREGGIRVFEIAAISDCLDARLRGHDELRHGL
jgi:hypothetical protein